uniref:Uncharacterized protein MANES_14G051100 n=1 Tax=Rhizophora mucronata TaxID=61149 RepID=A0A2P2JTL8_RHIMU
MYLSRSPGSGLWSRILQIDNFTNSKS